jgi:hypothetical protein
LPVYAACVCLLFFHMNLCIYSMYLFVYVYIYVFARALCVYILIERSSKNLCGITELDARYVTVCSIERMKSVISCIVV